MVDAQSQGNLLFLPLDKLMQLSASGLPDAGTSTRAVPQDAAPVNDPTGRSRESLRNREREARP
jgi:hypothetical protein